MCAKLAAAGSRVYIDEFDFSGVLSSFDQSVEQETPVVTCLSDAGPRRVVGNYDVAMSYLGFLEPTDDLQDEQIHLLLSDEADHYITNLPGASAAGSVAYDFIAQLSNTKREGQVGGAVLCNFDANGRGGVARGNVLANKTTTGAENIAGVNQGAKASTTSIYAVIFRILSFDGTDITLKIQESQNDGDPDAYVDVAGLTSGAKTGIAVVRVTTTAALEAWRRVVVSGTFNSAAIRVTAGIVQGT